MHIMTGHSDVVNVLVKSKAEINSRIFEFLSPLHLEENLRMSHKEIIDINSDDADSNFAPIYYAVLHSYEGIVKILIENGADINVEGGNLEWQIDGVATDDESIFDPTSFLMNGNLSGTFKCPLLIIACYFGYKKIVKILLKHKAKINIKCSSNVTPLHVAALREHTEIVRDLIERGAFIDALTVQNMTPLYMAAQNGNEEIVKILIKKELMLIFNLSKEVQRCTQQQ